MKINQGTYVRGDFDAETLNRLEYVQRLLKLCNPTPREKLHTTICYSRVYVPFIGSEIPALASTENHLEVWDTKYGKTLVLVLKSDHLAERHLYSKILGATYDFDEYKPHITLSYDLGVQKINLDDVKNIPIVVEKEKVEILDLNWE